MFSEDVIRCHTWPHAVEFPYPLLAMTFLMTWGIGLVGCPMSNTMLAMQGRYQAPFRELLRNNRIFSFKMTVLSAVMLNIYARMAV